MTAFRTFASGSSGNAALLECGGTRLLIDIGISCRRICQSLASLHLKPEDLSAILVTHEHSDHVKGLATYVKKYRTPVVCTPGTARVLSSRAAGVAPLLHTVPLGERLCWPEVEVDVLPTSHDASESAAYRMTTPDGQIGFLTDTGYIPEETREKMLGVELLALESNHDWDMLWSGPYPFYLKERIQSKLGHLNNRDAARFAAASACAGTRTILLAHLSQENNSPRLALETVRSALDETGWSGRLEIVPRDSMSPAYCLEGTPCGE